MENEASVIRQDRKDDDPGVEKTQYWLERSGKALNPLGCEYLGSACVHFYRAPGNLNTHVYDFGVVLKLSGIPEGQADVGLKELRRKMMASYGRVPN